MGSASSAMMLLPITPPAKVCEKKLHSNNIVQEHSNLTVSSDGYIPRFFRLMT